MLGYDKAQVHLAIENQNGVKAIFSFAAMPLGEPRFNVRFPTPEETDAVCRAVLIPDVTEFVSFDDVLARLKSNGFNNEDIVPFLLAFHNQCISKWGFVPTESQTYFQSMIKYEDGKGFRLLEN